MTIHSTPSGYAELLASWGHGHGRPGNPRRPATLITDDGDGHLRQWAYTGQLADALVTLARMEPAIGGGDHVAVREGAGYVVVPAPVDFWIPGPHGDLVPSLASYPDVIAY